MFKTQTSFDERVRGVSRKHKAMANGYVTKITSDGLIVVKPRRRKREFPVVGLALAGLGFFAFKAFMFALIGPVSYADRLELLQSGSILEQGGAWVMQADPATQMLAGVVRQALL